MTQISDLTLSTSSNTRWKFLRRTSATSWSVQFLCRSSSIRAGYFDTSSNPRGKLSKKNTFHFRKKNECARTVFCVSQYMLIQRLFCDTAFWTQWCLQQRNQIIHRSTATIHCSCLCLLEVQSYWFLPFFSLLTAETAKLLISWQANKSTKLIWFNNNFWKMKVPETSVSMGFVLFWLLCLYVRCLSDNHQPQCCRVSFLTILWPFNLVLRVVCMECFASEYVLLLGAFEVPTDSYRLGPNHALDVIKMVCKTQVEEVNRLMYEK